MGRDRNIRIWRGDVTTGRLVDYTVPVEDGEVVLDAVHRVQATQANDLAVRWNCKAGKRGSCSAEVNGRPRLMCMTRLSTLPDDPVTVTPLRYFSGRPGSGHRRFVQLRQSPGGAVVQPASGFETR